MRGVMRRPVVVLALLAVSVLLAPALALPRTVATAAGPELSLLRCDEVGMTLRGEGFPPAEEVELFVIADIPNPADAAPLGSVLVEPDGTFDFDSDLLPCPFVSDVGITVAARVAGGLIEDLVRATPPTVSPADTGHGGSPTTNRGVPFALALLVVAILGVARLATTKPPGVEVPRRSL